MSALVDFVPLPADLAEPKRFIAALMALFEQYPPEVIERAIAPVKGIPVRLKVLRLAPVKEILDEINAPFVRDVARRRASEESARCLPPPRRGRTPEEQARIDAQVADARAKLGVPELKRSIAPLYTGDGKHAERVAADLARRKAQQNGGKPSEQSDR